MHIHSRTYFHSRTTRSLSLPSHNHLQFRSTSTDYLPFWNLSHIFAGLFSTDYLPFSNLSNIFSVLFSIDFLPFSNLSHIIAVLFSIHFLPFSNLSLKHTLTITDTVTHTCTTRKPKQGTETLYIILLPRGWVGGGSILKVSLESIRNGVKMADCNGIIVDAW